MRTLKECRNVIIKMDSRIKDLEEMVKHKIDTKIKDLETHNRQLQTRIQELIENNVMGKGSDTNHDKTSQKSQKSSLHCGVCVLKFNTKKELRIHHKEMHTKSYSCTSCDETFDVRWKLESHHLQQHTTKTEFECRKCKKIFACEWRLQKHLKGHLKPERKFCHFYNNIKLCPYEEVGCKFKHSNAGQCSLGKTCSVYKCQFEHPLTEEANDIIEVPRDEAFDADNTFNTDSSNPGLVSRYATSTPTKSCSICLRSSLDNQCNRCKVRQMLGVHLESFAKTLDETEPSFYPGR